MATSMIGKAAIERVAFQEHVLGCSSCRYALADHGTPLALCATGTALWDAYQLAKMAPRVTFVFERVGGRIEVRCLDTPSAEEALALHTWLGSHVCACHDPIACGCVQFGLDMGREAKREPLR